MWAIAEGSNDTDSFWEKVKNVDPGLKEHFFTNLDDSPLLEGYDDGLLVVSWDHQCIESFQAYQPLRHSGTFLPHNGCYQSEDAEEIEFNVSSEWSIIDHHFEESRH